MSEHFGEASIFIRPDASKFRAELLAQLKKATAGVKVTIPVAATTSKATVETRKLAAAHKEAGISAAQLSAQEAQLAETKALSAAASSKLAAVETADALAVGELAAAKAKLQAAEVALAAARRANVAALTTENVELQQNTAATVRSAEAQVASARAAALEAASHRRAAGDVARHAAAQEQLTRGAGSSALSLLGVRGATLAASGAFLGGAAAITLLSQSVQGAIEDQETLFRVSRILGTELGEGSQKWSQTLADSFGLADDQALKFEGAIAEVLHNAGILPEQNQQLSQSLVELAADMAAFAHVPVEDTLRALQLGVVGNLRGLKQFIGDITKAEVTQEALRETGKRSADQLTRQELLLARIALIQQKASNQQGAFAASSGRLSAQTKILTANLDSLSDSVGSALIPALTLVTQDLVAVVKVAEQLVSLPGKIPFFDSITDFVGSHATLKRDLSLAVLFPPAAPAIAGAEGINQLGKALGFWGDQAQKAHAGADLTIGDLDRMRHDLPLVTESTEDVGKAFEKAAAAFRRGLILDITQASNQLDTLNDRLTRVRISGGSLGEELAAATAADRKAQEELAKADKAVATFSGPGAKGFATAKKAQEKALRDADAARRELNRLREELASGAQDAAEKLRQFVEDAAAQVQADLDAADQAFLDALGLRQGKRDLAILVAEGTKTLQDDIAAQRALQRGLRADIAEAARTITNVTLRRQKIQELTLALQQSRNTVKDLIAQQKQDRIDARRRVLEEREASLDADIEFAQITNNTGAEIRAHQAKIRFLDQQIAHAKRGTAQWKRLRNERAREVEAIKELRKENDKLKEHFKSLQFDFLQTQQGFAATLLSNLLPTAAVAGTVGSTAISTPTAGPVGGPQRPPDVGAGLGRASQIGAAQRGASQGQMSALIQIQRQMLVVITRLVGQRDHPEAVTQAARQAASMDMFGW